MLTRAYGLANLEYDVPNTPETVFESGSITEQFTAAAVVLLAQDGKLSLDDDVRKHLPELHDFGKPARSKTSCCVRTLTACGARTVTYTERGALAAARA